MSSGGKKMSRNKSVMSIESNPTALGVDANVINLKVEALADCVPISTDQLAKLLISLNAVEANEERLRILDTAKLPYLFTSDNLAKLVDITPSVKTRIAMIAMIGPRLTDPKSKSAYFTGLFRFNEDKETIEEILKARVQTISAAMFTKGDGLKALAGGAGRGGRGGALAGGRGGRGAPGRGRGSASSTSPSASSTPSLAAGSSEEKERSTPSVSPVPDEEEPATRSRANSDTSDLGEEHSIASYDDVLDSLDLMSKRLSRDPKKSPFKSPVMAVLMEDEDEDGESRGGSRAGSICGPSPTIGMENEEDGPETTSPPKSTANGSVGIAFPVPPPMTPGTMARLFPSADSPVMDEPAEEQPALRSRPNLLPSLPVKPVPVVVEIKAETMHMRMSPKLEPLPPSSHSFLQSQSEKSLTRTLSKRAVTLDELDMEAKEASHKAHAETLAVDALIDPVKVEPTPSALEHSNGHALSSLHSEKSASTVSHRGVPGATSIRLATVAATTKAPILTEDMSAPTSKSVPVTPVHPELHHSSTDVDLHKTVAAATQSWENNKKVTQTTVEQNRRNSDFFGLGHVGNPSAATVVPGAVKASVVPVGIRPTAAVFTDLASKSAFLVHMSRDDFLSLTEEVGTDKGNGELTYSYKELLRRNHSKQYGNLLQGELEKYLSEEDFVKVFQKTKTAFYEQVRWKQVEQKKKALLF